MSVQPNTRATFTSTVWNAPKKGGRSINPAKFGGPNVNIREGSKVKIGDGDAEWDVLRIFEDGTLHLATSTGGRRLTRRIPPSSKSWGNVWIVDGKRVSLDQSDKRPPAPKGGGPNREIFPDNIVLLGPSTRVRWTVEGVLNDGSVKLYTMSGERIVRTIVTPESRMWHTMYVVNG